MTTLPTLDQGRAARELLWHPDGRARDLAELANDDDYLSMALELATGARVDYLTIADLSHLLATLADMGATHCHAGLCPVPPKGMAQPDAPAARQGYAFAAVPGWSPSAAHATGRDPCEAALRLILQIIAQSAPGNPTNPQEPST